MLEFENTNSMYDKIKIDENMMIETDSLAEFPFRKEVSQIALELNHNLRHSVNVRWLVKLQCCSLTTLCT